MSILVSVYDRLKNTLCTNTGDWERYHSVTFSLIVRMHMKSVCSHFSDSTQPEILIAFLIYEALRCNIFTVFDLILKMLLDLFYHNSKLMSIIMLGKDISYTLCTQD